MTNKKVRTNSQHNHMCFILNMIIISFWFLSLGVFSYALFQVNIIPNKYLVIGYGVILLSTCIFLYMMFQSSKKIIKCFAYIIVVFSSLLFIYSTTYLNNTYHFFQSTQTKEHNTLTYSVVVLEVNSYNEITSLENKTISYLDDEYREALKQGLSSQITYKESLASEFGILPDQLLNSEVDAICLEESYLTLITEEIEEFSVLTKVIHTFEVKEKQNISSENSEIPIPITQEPFILYISGIDQYGSVNSARGRSDVNQLVIVNPKTNHILLVNTPRDYYVPLADTGGKKDKLTHAGIYGINKSIKTLEKLYDIDINHYLRVNFNTLIKVVDVIGGIDVESDREFRCHTNKDVYVSKGWNHFDGKAALAYARERYAYETGDHHRGANQQQVITSIINKVTKSHVLISKYNSILNTLRGSFQTDIATSTITSFIRYQLDQMPVWNIESIAVTGYNSYNYTYSMGTSVKLYVMEPNYHSVTQAKKRIEEVLNES